jgi:hypothetical protein
VAHLLGPGVTGASAWSPAAFALTPPRPAPPSVYLFPIKIEEKCTPKIYFIKHIENAKKCTQKIQKMQKMQISHKKCQK